MNLFQLIIAISVIVYVVSSLYFSISGRILNRKRDKKEDERYKEQHTVEEQIGVLTQRIGAITAENDRLNGVVRGWMAQANDYKIRLDAALKEKEEWQKEAEKLVQSTTSKRRNTKKGGE